MTSIVHRPRAEQLEDRRLLAADIDALTIFDVNEDIPAGIYLEAAGKLIFTAATDELGLEIQIADPATLEATTLDINPGFAGSSPNNITVIGDRVYFTAIDATVGNELRWFDASEAEPTVHTIDVAPGGADSRASSFIQVGDKLYFSDYDASVGYELSWIDTSLENPGVQTIDIYPGPNGSDAGQKGGFISVGDKLYFSARDATSGMEVMWIDTTLANPTAEVIDVAPGGNSSVQDDPGFILVGDKLFFSASDPLVSGRELRWIDTDANSPTVQTLDFFPGRGNSLSRFEPVRVGDRLYYAAYDSSNGTELRWIDTTLPSPVVQTLDVSPGGGSSDPRNLTVIGDNLYFSATDSFRGRELRWIDTSLASPSLQTIDIFPGSADSYPGQYGGFVASGDKIYFSAEDSVSGRELRWIDTSLASPTVETIDIYTGSEGSNAGLHGGFSAAGGKLFFTAKNNSGQRKMGWIDTNSASDAVHAIEGYSGLGGSNAGRYGEFSVSGEKLFFTAFDSTRGYEPRWIDTTAAGASVHSLDVTPGTTSSYAGEHGGFTTIANRVFFTASDSAHGSELRWIDTTLADPIVQTIDIFAGADDSSAGQHGGFATVGSKLFFAARDATSGEELRWIDTTSGDLTPKVIDINTGVGSSNVGLYGGFTAVGSKLFFSASDPVNGHELRWIDTSSTSPVVQTIELIPGSGNSLAGFFGEFTAVGDKLFFAADDPTHGFELRWIDTTSNSPTVQTIDIQSGATGSFAGLYGGFKAIGTKLYFTAEDSNSGAELRWIDTALESPTVHTIDIYPGGSGSNAGEYGGFAAVDNKLYFTANDPANGYELRWLDSAAATPGVQLISINPGASGSFAGHVGGFVSANGQLFFTARDDTNGYELRSIDTSATFPMVDTFDIYPGRTSSNAGQQGGFKAVEDEVFFSADVPGFGVEVLAVNLSENSDPDTGGPVAVTLSEDDVATSVDLLARASDPDPGDTLAIANLVLTTGNASGVVLNGNNLDVSPSYYNFLSDSEDEVLLYSYDIIDGNGGETQQTATLTISGANDQPQFAEPSYIFNLDENSDQDTVVGSVSAVDADLADNDLVYSIATGNTGNAFKIDPISGVIRVDNFEAIDFESNPSFDLTVQVDDNSGEANSTDATNVAISLNDLQAMLYLSDPIFDTVGEDSGVATFQLESFGDAIGYAFDVAYETFDGTATSINGLGGNDYEAVSDTVSFNGFDDREIYLIDVFYNNDDVVEAEEDFFIQLVSVTGTNDVDIQRDTGRGVIVDDDQATLTIADASAIEGDNGTTTLIFPVTLDLPVDADISFNYETADDTASLADGDYVGITTPSSFSIAAGETAMQIEILINGDGEVEVDETLRLIASNLQSQDRDVQFSDTVVDQDNSLAQNGGMSGGSANILQQEVIVGEAGLLSTVEVFTSGVGDFDFAVYRGSPWQSGTPAFTTVVSATESGGQSVNILDAGLEFEVGDRFVYQLQGIEESTSLNFRFGTGNPYPGGLHRNGSATGSLINYDLAFRTQMTQLDGASLPAEGTIVNDDQAKLAVNDISQPEDGVFEFTVTTDKVVSEDITFAWGTFQTPGQAEYGIDFPRIAIEPATIPAGNTSTTFKVPVVDDDVVEPDEFFRVQIYNEGIAGVASPSRVTLGQPHGLGTIENDDRATITVGDATVTEGDSGTSILSFPVALSQPVDVDVSFDYQTQDDSATTAANDYVGAASMPFTIAAGDTTGQIDIVVNGDEDVEIDEAMQLVVSNLNASGRDVQFADSITDQDNAPANTGSIVGSDTYTYQQEVIVGENGLLAGIELFTGGAGQFNFAIHRGAPWQTGTPEFATVVTATESGSQFVDIAASELDFAAGDRFVFEVQGVGNGPQGGFRSVSGNIYPGSLQRNGSAFGVTNSDLAFRTHITQVGVSTMPAEGTILNDDVAYLSIDDVSLAEDGNFVFAVTTDKVVNDDITMIVNTWQIGGGAESDVDYTALSNLPATIPAGSTSTSVTVLVEDDDIVEADEIFRVRFDNEKLGGVFAPSRLQVDNRFGLATILNDDSATLAVGDATVTEGDSGTAVLSFPVELSQPADVDVSFDYQTQDGTATIGDDYNGASATLVIPSGGTTAQIDIVVNSDTDLEIDETMGLIASNLNASGRDIQFADTIVDLDNPHASRGFVYATNTNTYQQEVIVAEAGLLSGLEIFTIGAGDYRLAIHRGSPWQSGLPEFSTVVTAVGPGSGSQFTDLSIADLTFAPGESFTVELQGMVSGFELSFPYGNSLPGDFRTNESPFGSSFDLALRSYMTQVGASSVPATGTIITDDEINLSIEATNATEGNDVEVTISADRSADEDITMVVTTFGVEAEAVVDFAPIEDFVATIPAGSTSTTLTISTVDDDIVEHNERFFIRYRNELLGGVSNPYLHANRNRTSATIIDDDKATLTVADATVIEGNNGTTILSFPVVLSHQTDRDVSFDYQIQDGTATVGDNDYNGDSAALIIPSGETTAQINVIVNGDDHVEFDETMQLVVSSLNTSGRDVQFADTITDQDNAPASTGAIVGSDTYTYQQEVIVGENGLLAGIELFTGGAGQFNFAIHRGTPWQTGTPEFATVVTATESGSQLIDISGAGLDFIVGDRFVFEVQGVGNGPQGGFQSVSGNIYPGSFQRNGSAFGVTNFDLAFRTHTTQVGIPTMPAVGTILNDDQASLSVNSISEPEEGLFEFTVTTDKAVDEDITFAWGTFETSGQADSDTDFTPVTNRHAIIAAGNTTTTFSVVVNDDDLVELDEFFRVRIFNEQIGGQYSPSRLTVGEANGFGTIVNQDSATLTVGDATSHEGDNGTSTLSFPIFLSQPADVALSFDFQAQDGSATVADLDFAGSPLPQPFTLAANSTVGQIDVTVNGDNKVEQDETLQLVLNGLNSMGRDVEFSDTDIDQQNSADSGSVSPSSSLTWQQEVIADTSGQLSGLTIFTSGAGEFEFSLNLGVPLQSDGDDFSMIVTATEAGPQFVDLSAADLRLATGDRFAFKVRGINDGPQGGFRTSTNDSYPGRFFLNGSQRASTDLIFQTHVTLTGLPETTGIGNILNDDQANLSISDVSQVESGSFLFTITSDKAASQDITMSVNTIDIPGQAVSGTDYTSIENTIATIPTGSTAITVEVLVSDDALVEADETFSVRLSNERIGGVYDPTRLRFSNSNGVGAILNDDAAPIAIMDGPYLIDEGQDVTFDASLSSDADLPSQTLFYRWDINNDNVFDFDTADVPTLTLTWAQLESLGLSDGLYKGDVVVEVSDGTNVDTAPSAFTIENAAPFISIDPSAITIDEGTSTTRAVVVTDVVSDTVVVTASVGTITGNGTDSWLWSYEAEDDLATSTVVITATDEDGGSATESFELTVNNDVPVAEIAGPNNGVTGQTRTFTLSATDPSQIDQAAGFTFHVDWDGDGISDESISGIDGTQVQHIFTTPGTYSIGFTATDKDGGISLVSTKSIVIVAARLQGGNLLVGGTAQDDTISFIPGPNPGDVEAILNGVSLGIYQPTGELRAYGEDGDDMITIDSAVTLPGDLRGGAGNDILLGGGGPDRLIGGDGDDELDGGDNDDVLRGNAGLDTLSGGDGNDDLNGGGGSDEVSGNGGNDIVRGGSGADILNGGADADILLGGGGADQIFGDGGGDILIGGNGNDWLGGGSGSDVLIGSLTIHDGDNVALRSLLAEWDSSNSLADRIANLRDGSGTGGGANSGVFLGAGIDVLDDEQEDSLNGNGSRDWFFVASDDLLADRIARELVESL